MTATLKPLTRRYPTRRQMVYAGLTVQQIQALEFLRYLISKGVYSG